MLAFSFPPQFLCFLSGTAMDFNLHLLHSHITALLFCLPVAMSFLPLVIGPSRLLCLRRSFGFGPLAYRRFEVVGHRVRTSVHSLRSWDGVPRTLVPGLVPFFIHPLLFAGYFVDAVLLSAGTTTRHLRAFTASFDVCPVFGITTTEATRLIWRP